MYDEKLSSLHHFFRNNNGVFVIITFPDHVSDQNILTKRQFAIVNRHTVGDRLPAFNFLAFINNRSLIDAG